MKGWPKLSSDERILVAKISGAAVHATDHPEDAAADNATITALLDEVLDREQLGNVLAMAAQAYVDDEYRHRVAVLLEEHGADLDLARKYQRARLDPHGFSLATMADSPAAVGDEGR